jgi:anti-sigma factor RsiW
MYSCSRFLRDFSEYRDGLMDPAERALAEAHLAGCSSCAGYARVLQRGVVELQALPRIEPSEDFLPRLQHRLYALEDRVGWGTSGNTSATSVGFIMMVVMLIGAAAWFPVVRPKAAVVEMPAALASAPEEEDALHTLFRAGPLLTPPQEIGLLTGSGSAPLFSSYTPLRLQAYQARAIRPR